jgi:hypothetical protein
LHVFEKPGRFRLELFNRVLDGVGLLDRVIQIGAECVDSANALGVLSHSSSQNGS